MATGTCNYQYPGPLSHDPCPEPAWDDAGRCFFHSASHHKTAAEMVARVKKKLDKGDNDFIGYVFPARVDFSRVDFGEGASFWFATFGDGANFRGATFGNGARFWFATFGDGASFFRANFGDGANFGGATFGDRASFGGATFGDRADFWDATFGDGASFFRANFGDDADFRIANPKERFLLQEVTFQGRADFSGVTQDLSHFEFHHVRLPRAVFRDAIGLDKAEFDNVTWGVLGDEVEARRTGRAEDIAAAERVYREIRRSYVNRLDFTMARQMHWGEMEMRRLGEAARRREAHKAAGESAPWPNLSLTASYWPYFEETEKGELAWAVWPHLTLTTAYWLLSGYGQRWGNALVALALLWLVCGVLFAVLGVQFSASPVEVSNAFGDGLIQSALSLVLHPTDYARPATALGWALEFLELVASPVIITTLVLAVREQFRH